MNLDRLKDQLFIDEGYRRSAYQDTEGLWTIGIGRMIDAELNGGISEDEAKYLLANDLESVFRELDRNAPWWRDLPSAGQEAICNMCFNLGWPRLSKFSKMITALKEGRFYAAADEALDSKWARQVGDRAERIAEQFRSCK